MVILLTAGLSTIRIWQSVSAAGLISSLPLPVVRGSQTPGIYSDA
jgi:hypothetical protein